MAWHSAASKIREAFHILLWFQLKKELWFYFDFFVSLGFWFFWVFLTIDIVYASIPFIYPFPGQEVL